MVNQPEGPTLRNCLKQKKNNLLLLLDPLKKEGHLLHVLVR